MNNQLQSNFQTEMNSTACVFLLLVLCALSAYGAVSSGSFEDPKNPGKCTINKNLILSPGEEVKDPNQDCALISCGESSIASIETCGIGEVEGCRMGDYINKNLPYPKCCERHLICD